MKHMCELKMHIILIIFFPLFLQIVRHNSEITLFSKIMSIFEEFTFILLLTKIQRFPLSMLIFDQIFCILGPIPSLNIHNRNDITFYESVNEYRELYRQNYFKTLLLNINCISFLSSSSFFHISLDCIDVHNYIRSQY